MTPMAREHDQHESGGGRLITVDGRALPLTAAELRVDARGGIARVVLEQRFHNPFGEPLRVTYLMPLPADGAVSGYAFRIGDRRVTGEVDRRAAARERFEQALISGHTAALLEEERSSLFTQEVGNIPPGADVVVELTIDQRLAWLDEGQWEWRFPTAAAPRYLGEPGRVADAAKITVDVADRPLPARMALTLRIRDRLAGAGRPESPSHALGTQAGAAEATDVRFATDGGVPLDRDVVVRWPVAQPTLGVSIDLARPTAGGAAYALLTMVPPGREAPRATVARDLILLLDTSGSMDGAPLDQARRVAQALVDTLSDGDRLEMIEFSDSPRRWKGKAIAATASARRDALAWLGQLEASGGTEMRSGILEALRPLRAESQRQIVVVTDGQIGSEAEVIHAIAAGLPSSSRVHVVGVGSAVNRSLTGPAARAGRGLEVVIGLGEDPERAARRLVARSNAPIVVEVEVEGSALLEAAPRRAPDLFAGAPSLSALKLRPEGGEITVRGRMANGQMEHRITVPPVAAGSGSTAVRALFARELVEDLELDVAAQIGDRAALESRIEALGLEHQIGTRLTSWVAVSSSPTVDPQSPTRREVMPQELPHGMSMEGLGLRGPAMFGAPMGMAKSAIAHFAAAPSVVAPSPARPRSAGSAKMKKELSEGAASGAANEKVLGEAAPRLRGRVVRRKARELVIEVTVDADFDWEIPARVTVTVGEQEFTATVEAARSTRPGRIAGGHTLRITLTVAAGAETGTLDAVTLELPILGAIRIELG